MITAEDVMKLVREGESNRVEMKRCKDTVPESVWETYSAFANTRGGVILLGVTEQKNPEDGERFKITGVEDANKVVTDFFNMINNTQKVNQSVLVDSDVRIVPIEDKVVIHIRVPEADYRRKPIYIKGDIKNGTYRRVHEGDRHATQAELGMMLRDSSEELDMQIIEHYGMDDVDSETLRKYRQAFRDHNYGHTFEELNDKDFLLKMGAYRLDRQSGIEGLTMAGLLMFGKSLPIHENFPNFRFDYLDLIGIELGDSKKWNDRLTDDGRWEDNIYNFLTLAMRKLLFTLPSEGKLHGVHRVDGGPLHEAVREAMINCITYCDYRLGGVLRIDRKTDRIVMRNPGSLRISPERIYNGEFTQARNGTIQKMLRMLGYGDNIGSGFHKIMTAWQNLGFPKPTIHEEDEVNEVWLTLPVPSGDTEKGIEKGIENADKNLSAHLHAQIPAQNYSSTQNELIDIGVSKKMDLLALLHAQIPTHLLAQLDAQQVEILTLIIQNPHISMKEIGTHFNRLESWVRSQRRRMNSIIELQRVGADKNGTWEIRIKE